MLVKSRFVFLVRKVHRLILGVLFPDSKHLLWDDRDSQGSSDRNSGAISAVIGAAYGRQSGTRAGGSGIGGAAAAGERGAAGAAGEKGVKGEKSAKGGCSLAAAAGNQVASSCLPIV